MAEQTASEVRIPVIEFRDFEIPTRIILYSFGKQFSMTIEHTKYNLILRMSFCNLEGRSGASQISSRHIISLQFANSS